MAHLASNVLALLLLVSSLLHLASSARSSPAKSDSDQTQQPFPFQYHKGPLLTGKIAVNLIWYGKFKPSQRAIIADFVASLSTTRRAATGQPSVAAWWKTIESYHRLASPKRASSLKLSLASQTLDESYSLGKSLTSKQITALAARGGSRNAVNVVLTASDVAVEKFCSSRCGTHGFAGSAASKGKFAYVWVGNSATQCPGQCAWPFHQPIYGPQTAPLGAPNADVGLDGMVINLASLLAGTATNPFGNGYFQGPKEAPLEAGSACTGVYAKGAYPGYPGDVLVDPSSGASYNAHGANGRKYLLPALYDPSTATCSTLV